MRRFALLLGLFVGLILVQGCKTIEPAVYPDPVIGAADFNYWIHSPLHPDNNQAVTFKTEATDNEGITKIELFVYEFELYENKDGLPSKRKKIDSQWGKIYDWEFDGTTTTEKVEFSMDRGFKAFSNIEYIFRVTNKKGELSERLAIFDAGDSRWPLDKITLYATSRSPLTNSINLCLFPDVDYDQDWRGFLTDMEGMIYDGFHQNNKIEGHKENWQFYYTQRDADGFAISKNFYEDNVFPSFVKNAEIQGIDAYGLMHKEPYSDGAYLKNNIHFLAYNLFTSESYNYGTAVHESAHAIFNLSDEYDLCACFEHPDGANMFSSLKKCQDFNKENGFPISDCTPLEHLNGQSWYMSEPSVMFDTKETCEGFNAKNGYREGSCERFKDHDGRIYYRAVEGLCIMQDDGDNIIRDFRRTCSRIIDKFYEKLNQTPAIALTSSLEDIENIFGYEPVVMMEMVNQEEKLAFQVKGVQLGIPRKNITQRDAIKLDFIQSSGEKFSLTLPEPDHMHIHNDVLEDEVIHLPKVSYTFSIPYKTDLQTMICAQQADKNQDTKQSSKIDITRLDLTSPLKKAENVMSSRQ